jgi:uncharacterized membrane protein
MQEFLLKYPQMLFDQGELVFAREWAPVIAYAVLATVAVLLLAMLIWKRRALVWWQLAVIGLLQTAMVALVLLMIWQPAILTEQLRQGDNVVALMLDTSSSMNYSEGDSSRMQQAMSVINGDSIARVGSQYTLQRFVFAADARSVESFEPLPAPTAQSSLGSSVQQVLSMSRASPLGAVVLVSDGADNAGALTQEQLAEIARFGVPVHTIGIGNERIAEDLELQDITLPGQAMPGTILTARVAIRHDEPGVARLKVYDGENLITANEIQLQPGTDVTTAWVDVPVSEAGYRDLRFTLDARAGEQITENNTRSRVVEVKEEKYRVLYIEGEPRWEYKFMRRALEKDPSVELVSLLRVSQNKFYRQGIHNEEELAAGFPLDKGELFGFNALIIGSIEAPVFTAEQQQLIHDFVNERGGSLLMLAGPNGLGNGGWGNAKVGELLPVTLPAEAAGFVRSKVRAMLTPAGAQSPMLRLSQDIEENRRLWQELPEIADYQSVGVLKPASTVLLNAQLADGERPLLITQPYGRGQTFVMATGGTWRWQMSLPSEDQRHETFWRQLLREMVINTPGRFRLFTEVSGDEVRINAELLDDNFKPERDLRLTAIVSAADGTSTTLDLQPSAELPGVMTAGFKADQSGLYSIEAISRRGDEPIDSARIAVHHDAGTAEFYSLRKNNALLQQLAVATGGRNWALDELDELSQAISYSAAGITEQQLHPLWDAPLLFLLLLLLKAIEWSLRRYWKTI